MTQQVEVRLVDGGSETIGADSWSSTDRGGLDVLKTGDSTSGTVVATFAPGQWSFVSKVTDGTLSVGDLTLRLHGETRPVCSVCGEFTDSQGMCPGCVE